MLPKDPKWYFWRRRGWLRYPLLVLLLCGTAVALRGGLWSQTPAKAAKRAAQRSLKAKSKPLPKVQMFLEHNEQDINLKIKKGKHVLPSPVITREDRKVIVELAGVQVRPRKWTLSGSRVSSINVKVDKKGSKLVIAQDPKVKGTLKDAFSAEDINGNLVLRVLNQSIGDRQAHPAHPAIETPPAKIAKASTLPSTPAKHPLGQKLNRQNHPGADQRIKPAEHHGVETKKNHRVIHPANAKGESQHGSPVHAPTGVHHDGAKPHAAQNQHAPQNAHSPAVHPPVQVVEHPTTPLQPASPGEEAGNHPTMVKSALSMAASVLAFGLLALVPLLWWKKKQSAPTQDIKVQERLALSPKHSLVRVKLGAKDLWLGLSEGNIQVITPAESLAKTSAPLLRVAPDIVTTGASDPELYDDQAPEPLPEPMPAAVPTTLARRKLAAFKMRLSEALAHPDSDPGQDFVEDAGRQADAIRRELARRQAHSNADSGMHQDAA